MNKYLYAPGKIIWNSNTNRYLLIGEDKKKYWVGYNAYLAFLKKQDTLEAQEDWKNKIMSTREELNEIAQIER